MNPQQLINEMIDGKPEGTEEQKKQEADIQNNQHWLEDSVTTEKLTKMEAGRNAAYNELSAMVLNPKCTDVEVRVQAMKVAVAEIYIRNLINP